MKKEALPDLSNLTDEQREILREAESRGSLIDSHPDLKDRAPDSPRDTRYQPIHYDHTGGPAVPVKPVDPRTMGPQPTKPQTGYGGGIAAQNEIDTDEYREKFWGKR